MILPSSGMEEKKNNMKKKCCKWDMVALKAVICSDNYNQFVPIFFYFSRENNQNPPDF